MIQRASRWRYTYYTPEYPRRKMREICAGHSNAGNWHGGGGRSNRLAAIDTLDLALQVLGAFSQTGQALAHGNGVDAG